MSREALLAVGATLVMLGVITRGLAAGQRRAAALRKQHDLDVRKPGEALPPVPHLEKHLSNYANGAIVLGVVLVVAGYLR
jgi:hypothetical protein